VAKQVSVEGSDAGLPSDPTKELAEAIDGEELLFVRGEERICVVGVVSAAKVAIHLAGHGDVEVHDAGTLDLTGLRSNRDLAVLEVEVAHQGDAMSQLILTVLSGVAEFERSLISEWTALAARAAIHAGRS